MAAVPPRRRTRRSGNGRARLSSGAFVAVVEGEQVDLAVRVRRHVVALEHREHALAKFFDGSLGFPTLDVLREHLVDAEPVARVLVRPFAPVLGGVATLSVVGDRPDRGDDAVLPDAERVVGGVGTGAVDDPVSLFATTLVVRRDIEGVGRAGDGSGDADEPLSGRVRLIR